VVGTVLEVFAVLIVIRVITTKRRNRHAATMPAAPAPEPYANLQVAMARLHETEDKHHAE
jgi:hypothetical protein